MNRADLFVGKTLDTLADGRELRRFRHDLSATVQPGQSLRDGHYHLPIFRHDSRQKDIDLIVRPDHAQTPQHWQISGSPLRLPTDFKRLIFVSQDDGIFAVLHALHGMAPAQRARCVVLSEFQVALPFRPAPSRFLSAHLPAHVMAAIPLLDDWRVLNRIAHPEGLPGCYEGPVGDLLARLQHEDDIVIMVAAP